MFQRLALIFTLVRTLPRREMQAPLLNGIFLWGTGGGGAAINHSKELSAFHAHPQPPDAWMLNYI